MWLIVKKETLENILTLRFIIGFFAANLVFGIMSWVLVGDYQNSAEAIAAEIHEEEQIISNWETWSFVRPTVFRRPELLNVFGSDEGKDLGSEIWISNTHIPAVTGNSSGSGAEANFLAMFYSFDYVSVAQIFVTLLALLFSFDMICGEKERATLKLMLSNAVNRSTLFTGKYLGALISLGIILTTAFILSLLIILPLNNQQFTGSQWMSFVMIFVVTLLTGGVFIGLGMLVSTIVHRSATSLIVCMVLWILFILIVPNVVGFASSTIGFNEDARVYQSNLNELRAEYLPRISALGYSPRDYMATSFSHTTDTGEAVYRMVSPNARSYLASLQPDVIAAQSEYATRRYDIERRYVQKRDSKLNLLEGLLRLSPAYSYVNVVNAFAGTNRQSHAAFIRQARRYRQSVMAFIDGNGGFTSDRWFTNDTADALHSEQFRKLDELTLREQGEYIAGISDVREQFGTYMNAIQNDPQRRLDLSEMPGFDYQPPSFTEAFQTAMLDLILLITYQALLLVLSFVLFMRYDPR